MHALHLLIWHARGTMHNGVHFVLMYSCGWTTVGLAVTVVSLACKTIATYRLYNSYCNVPRVLHYSASFSIVVG